MPDGRVEILRRIYEAVGRGDFGVVFQDTGPDIEWETDPRLPNAGTYRGPEEIQRFFQDQQAPFEEFAIEPEKFVANGDHVVALIRVRYRPKGSVAEMEHEIGHLWTFRDGQVVRGQAFAERAKALEAAGLSK